MRLIMNNTGIIITLAYPETVVMVADEWYSFLLRFLGIGKKDYIRAGHAALVLINTSKGDLEYYDFGRYITKAPYGRVRGGQYDFELNLPLKADISENTVQNLDEILLFLANHSHITHGDGKLIASICNCVDYEKAKSYMTKLQRMGSIRYAAFKKNATNCARFVTSVIIESVINTTIKHKLLKSQRFTPSPIGNVVLANTETKIYEVESNSIKEFKSSALKLNRYYFLDKLTTHSVDLCGSIEPKKVLGINKNAKWLSGIGAGAWYELTKPKNTSEYELRMRRISPNGNVDIDAVFTRNSNFDINKPYQLMHNSNCKYCTVFQNKRFHCLVFDRLF